MSDMPRDPWLTAEDDWDRGIQHGLQLGRVLIQLSEDDEMSDGESCEALHKAITAFDRNDLEWLVVAWLTEGNFILLEPPDEDGGDGLA